MAYDYNNSKKLYQSLSKEQQQQFIDQNKNDANFQRFMNEYIADVYGSNGGNVYTPDTTNKVTNANISSNSYGDVGGAANATKYTGYGVSSAGDYTYNSNLTTGAFNPSQFVFGKNAETRESQTPGYLEQRNNYIANALYNEGKYDESSVRNYLSTFQDYRDYDTVGQNNTVTAIMNRMGNLLKNSQGNTPNTVGTGNNTDLNSRLTSEIWSNYENAQKGYSDLMGGGANYYDNFRDAVKGKLQTAYGISDLNEFKRRYPEQYESMYQALSAVEGVWNATNPNERQMLDGQLQGIIGSGVGAGSDWSKLSVLESSIMDKFKNPEKIKSDAQNVIKLQTEGKNTAQIAKEMGISEDQVQQLILLANGLDSKAGEYYQLKSDVASDITEPFDTKMDRMKQEKDIALERANRNVERLKQDFDTNMDRQRQQNDINLHNADFLAGQYGYGFSRRGIEGLNYVSTQAQQILDDLTKNYDRNSQEMADGIADIIRNWQRNNEDLMKASQDALTAAKNSFTSNMLAIQQQYGTVGLQAQQALANNVQNFITQAENIYDNALTRQQQNLSNLITNVSNLNALAYNNLTLRNAKIQQFQAESMNLNRNQLQGLAQQLGMDTNSYQDLVNYQVQAVANELNGYLPGAGMQFQSDIQSLLDSGYTPNQAMQSIMNSDEFKQLANTGSGDNWSISGGIMYNKATGEYMDLNSDQRGNAGSNAIYNKSTGEVRTVSGGTVSTTNPDTGAYQRVKLGETPNEDTGIPNVYGNTVKLAPTVGAMLNEAYNALAAQGIELKIADSYRSYESQKQAYDSGKEGVVSPDKSYHVLGQAFDLSQSAADGMKDNEAVTQALLDAGFTRPNAKEWWHWSYGEGKDAFGGKPRNSDAYDMARAILNGTADKPSKNTTFYTDVSLALNDLVNQIRPTAPTSGSDLIEYSVLKEKDLDSNTAQSITSTFVGLSNTDRLMELLEANGFQTGPIMSRIAKLNPRNKGMAEIKSQINTMAAGIARGFGEKGVLSDKDIERYMSTLPHEALGERAQQAVGDLLKITLYKSLVNSLENAAKQGKDVHMYIDDYNAAVNYLQSVGAIEGTGGGRGLTGDIDLSSYGRS